MVFSPGVKNAGDRRCNNTPMHEVSHCDQHHQCNLKVDSITFSMSIIDLQSTGPCRAINSCILITLNMFAACIFEKQKFNINLHMMLRYAF